MAAALALGLALCAVGFALLWLGPTPPVAQPSRMVQNSERPLIAGAVLHGSDGWLYSFSQKGGRFGLGTVFRFQPAQPDALEVLVHFSGRSALPGGLAGEANCGLNFEDGVLYGTSERGGAQNAGTIFKVGADGAATTLYEFGAAMKEPTGLKRFSDGLMWGALAHAGIDGKEGLFKFNPATRQLDLVFSCGGPENPVPSAPSVMSFGEPWPGYRLMVTSGPGFSADTALISITGNGSPQLRHRFPKRGQPDFMGEIQGFVRGADGAAYFVTQLGGNSRVGTIQRLVQDSPPPVIVGHCNGENADSPLQLLPLPDGRMICHAKLGEAYDQGSLCLFHPPPLTGNGMGDLQELSSFHHFQEGDILSVTPGPDGTLFGIQHNERGSRFFRFDPDRPGPVTEMRRLRPPVKEAIAGPPSQPGRLVAGADGQFYGLCAGGSTGHGLLFRWKEGTQPETLLGDFERVAEFTGKDGDLPGSGPHQELLPVGADFYGTCPAGGANGRGVIFKLSAAGEARTLVEF